MKEMIQVIKMLYVQLILVRLIAHFSFSIKVLFCLQELLV